VPTTIRAATLGVRPTLEPYRRRSADPSDCGPTAGTGLFGALWIRVPPFHIRRRWFDGGLMLCVADASTTWIAVGSIGTFIAALATLGVALLTRSVATGTRDVADETKELAVETRKLAAATEAAVETTEEPFVIAVPSPPEAIRLGDHESGPLPSAIHRGLGSEGPFVRLRLWNIGTGPAIVEVVSLRRPEQGECIGSLPGGFRPVGAGQWADMEIRSSGWPAVLGDGTLRVTYTHSSGRKYETVSDVTIGDPTVTCLTYARSRAAGLSGTVRGSPRSR
jgi:hypothetical protein